MRNITFRAVAGIVALASMGAVHAASEAWTTSFEAAKVRAAAENKSLLVNFTGSDWCHWCIQLDKEVFQKPPFEEKALSKFVLVKLDYPKDKSAQPGPEQAQNESLLQTYPISGYPTVLLCDASGRPFAATGYQQGGPEKYLEHLDTLLKKKDARDEAFAKAAKAEGVEKARQLIEALEAMELGDKMVSSLYSSTAAEIIKADPEDQTGYASKQAAERKLAAFLKNLAKARGDLDAAMKVVTEALADPEVKGETRQQVYGYQAGTLAYAGKKAEAIEVLEKAVKEDPEGSRTAELKNFIEILKKEQAAPAPSATPEKKSGE